MRTKITGKTKAFSNRIARAAIRFYASVLLTVPQLKKLRLRVVFTRTYPRRVGAEMWQDSRNKYTIKVSSLNGPYRTLMDLGHEMLHVQQFMSGLMVERSGATAWKGRIYRGDFMKDNDAYYNAPWEIDANGRSYWLYKRCRLHLVKHGFKLRRGF